MKRRRIAEERSAAVIGLTTPDDAIGFYVLLVDWDGEAVSQFERVPRHAEVAREMLARGHAYRCFATQDEIEAFREAARAEERPVELRHPVQASGVAVIEPERPADTGVTEQDPRPPHPTIDGTTLFRCI